MNLALARQDIVGHPVTAYWQSAWQCFGEVSVAQGWVELASGGFFELLYGDPDDTPVIPRLTFVDLKNSSPKRISSPTMQNVREVVSSEYWPSMGLLFDDGTLAYLNDNSHPKHLGIEFSKLGEWYRETDLLTFWGKQLLVQQ